MQQLKYFLHFKLLYIQLYKTTDVSSQGFVQRKAYVKQGVCVGE